MSEAERIEREKCLQIIEGYRPLDDDFMRELFRDDIPLTEYVLRVITGIEDLSIIKSETQFDLHRLAGARSLRLDVLGTDSTGKKINLEVQRADAGATSKRARYHSSSLDVEFLKTKDDFSMLPETYVIFITENDVKGKGKLLYQYEWREKDGSELGDDTHILFVNGAYDKKDDMSELAKLMHDFRCSRADDMLTGPLADKTRKLKETPEGVDTMCKAIEENNKRIEKNKSIEIAVNLIRTGVMSYSMIADCTGLSLEEVEKLAETLDHTA
jgi:predicted transposase/invertase (TIGR01784 family)